MGKAGDRPGREGVHPGGTNVHQETIPITLAGPSLFSPGAALRRSIGYQGTYPEVKGGKSTDYSYCSGFLVIWILFNFYMCLYFVWIVQLVF